MANIFISYRRDDSGGHAGRLCDRLSSRFGDDRVFMDLQDIAPGQDFARSIDAMIATCECVIAVIGPRWLEAMQQRAGAEDFVHHEIAAALRRDITVIPVLVGGARMPSAGQLPPALAPLRHRNAFELRDDRFDHDVAILGDAIARAIAADGSGLHDIGRRYRAPLIAAAGLVAAAAAAYVLWPRAAPPPPPPAETASAAPAAAALDGNWIADVQKEGQPTFRIALSFATAGDSISGMVRYPTGEAPIADARLERDVLTFHTSHIPQFESAPAVIRYTVELAGDEMRFVMTDQYGLGRGVARRAPVAGTVRVNPKDNASYVWIPPGRFVMGCSPGDPACETDEQPPHQVEIARGFWLAKTEVADGRHLPATGMSWAAAKAHCAAVGGRLPTEAEWEYAARAGTTTRAYDSLSAIAWFAGNSEGRPRAVGGRKPNAFGLHDMLGNVSEWVLDRYYSNAYGEPGHPGEVEEPLAGNASAVARGGSWLSDADGVRVSRRLEVLPDAEEPHVGFRCAIDRL